MPSPAANTCIKMSDFSPFVLMQPLVTADVLGSSNQNLKVNHREKRDMASKNVVCAQNRTFRDEGSQKSQKVSKESALDLPR